MKVSELREALQNVDGEASVIVAVHIENCCGDYSDQKEEVGWQFDNSDEGTFFIDC